MLNHRVKLAALLGLSFVGVLPAFAATPVDLSHQTATVLRSLSSLSPAVAVKETSRTTDFNRTLHIRVQETYAGYPVWGGDAVVHVTQGAKSSNPLNGLLAAGASGTTMNGIVYQDLAADLKEAAPAIFNQAQASKAIQEAVSLYQQKTGVKTEAKDKHSELMVYVDAQNKAHWAYLITFHVDAATAADMPAKPALIMDATTFQVYQQWNEVKTIGEGIKVVLDPTAGGGFGGNRKLGKLVYDGLEGSLPSMDMQRDAATQLCYLRNADVTVKDLKRRAVAQFKCEAADANHNNIFWNADSDTVNGGYSPSNDALYAGKVVKEMYQRWYDIPVLVKDGKPMMLVMNVHAAMDNAYWDGSEMTFGDGQSMFYPLTSLGVAAHEVSHGFTEQHSGLRYYGQSGGLNESFSDMAAQAAEFYSFGYNSWQIGPEIMKEDRALRYLDQPSRDCGGKKPGNWCSIDHMSQYTDYLDVHFSSGIFNRAFYTLATTEGWNTKTAFNVMVKANAHYWTSASTFAQSACGVMKAAKDYNYDVDAVVNAFTTVGVDTSKCS
ncbi:MAG: hypothetical protein A3J38_02290 [Gammaproteobacteria bacterium RIFCSPHIGHO2_12_FULL_45_9]|nr:MAG: hypothetical protein A3J38_02290 [Gammaproteobacteria bacterium RIFCSPHIGHO2_12_FULL_45_9]